jgi:UDP-N-acetylmuramate dehydrogenase
MSQRPAAFGERTTLRVGGGARAAIEVEDRGQLDSLVASLGSATPLYVLGRGSNTLVADAGFDGVVVHLGQAFAEIRIEPTTSRLVAGGAADLPVVARRSVEAGLSGFEWAVGVPGTIGGGVKMNAGGHGSSMAESVLAASVMDLSTGSTRVLDREQLGFAYRHSALSDRQLVLDATLQLAPGDPEAGRAALAEIVRWRREHQPGGSNCGSVFANPPGDSAGRLIEAADCKGIRLGSASVSSKHANFIQVDPGGSADDVRALIELVRARVEERFGLRLDTEVKLVGFEPGYPVAPRGEG